jgi:hypothetical protein
MSVVGGDKSASDYGFGKADDGFNADDIQLDEESEVAEFAHAVLARLSDAEGDDQTGSSAF